MENKNIISYETFLSKAWVKDVITQITDSTIYYSIDNIIIRMNVDVSKSSDDVIKMVDNFKSTMNELLLMNDIFNGVGSNTTIDRYVYELLTNQTLNLRLTVTDKGVTKYLICSSENADVSVSLKENYMSNLYTSYVYNGVLTKDVVAKALGIGNTNKVIVGDDVRLLNIDDEAIVKDIRNTISSLISKIIINKSIKNQSRIKRFINRLLRRTPRFAITLNDRSTILSEYRSIENNRATTWRKAIDNMKELDKTREELSKVTNELNKKKEELTKVELSKTENKK